MGPGPVQVNVASALRPPTTAPSLLTNFAAEFASNSPSGVNVTGGGDPPPIAVGTTHKAKTATASRRAIMLNLKVLSMNDFI